MAVNTFLDPAPKLSRWNGFDVEFHSMVVDIAEGELVILEDA